ncbi:MAG: hypothetical protein JSC189_000154 [Candidatus Tokpelaia sp. JSC189]|nr:MAG: hypothetical protein JSC189_000154 [Candidatus Tokpelaia sp. JSC189]
MLVLIGELPHDFELSDVFNKLEILNNLGRFCGKSQN